MAKTAKIEVKDGDLLLCLREFFRSVFKTGEVTAMLVPMHLPMKQVIMPVLVSDPERLDDADPLAPSFPMNSATLVSRLTRKPSGGKIAAVLRSCEIRAFTELVKLKQGSRDELVIIGIDCMGAYTNADYRRFSEKESTATFYGSVLSGKGTAVSGADLAPACSICEHPVPEGADIIIGLFGIDVRNHLLIQGMTPKGESMLSSLGLPESGEPEERRSAIESLISIRTKSRDNLFDKTAHATDTLEKLTAWLSGCINCYNCRVVCPVCYCKECVFVTDVFRHEPSQYLQWAERKGVVKMPTDTIFYHLTRMAHMSTACVGCGQCSNACPNDINVMELFRTVAHNTQKAFNYEAGRSPDEAPPLSEFREQEFGEVVGIN